MPATVTPKTLQIWEFCKFFHGSGVLHELFLLPGVFLSSVITLLTPTHPLKRSALLEEVHDPPQNLRHSFSLRRTKGRHWGQPWPCGIPWMILPWCPACATLCLLCVSHMLSTWTGQERPSSPETWIFSGDTADKLQRWTNEYAWSF